MTRFGDDGWDEYFPNQDAFWQHNLQRALGGKRGQQALRDLEEALLALPEPRLISTRLADHEGGMCAVGAYVMKKRLDAGEDRDEVLRDLMSAIATECLTCYHSSADHEHGGRCSYTRKAFHAGEVDVPCDCQQFVESGYDYAGEGSIITAERGRAVGLTLTLAWHLEYKNDEGGHRDETPEQRYDRVLAWTRKMIQPEEVAA